MEILRFGLSDRAIGELFIVAAGPDGRMAAAFFEKYCLFISIKNQMYLFSIRYFAGVLIFMSNFILSVL